MITVKHRRATPEGWDAIDPVIPDGELALTKKSSGVEIRVGDGSTVYSELLPINGRRILNLDTHPSIFLEDGDEVHCRYVESMEIYPHIRNGFFSATVSFDTAVGSYVDAIIHYTEKILFTGDDIEEEYFSPAEGTHYTLHIWYDGKMNCDVRGVYVG
jgi:hypothetical protein